jgi:hypothetical protein
MLQQGKEQQPLLLSPLMAMLAAARLVALCCHSRCCTQRLKCYQIIDSRRLLSSETPALQQFSLCAVSLAPLHTLE